MAAKKPPINVDGDPSQGSGNIQENSAVQNQTPAQPLPEPVIPAASKVSAPKAKDDRKAMLDKLRADSLARVNRDTFDHDESKSRFDVPKNLIPDGFTVEWKNTHVLGQPVDAAYLIRLQEGGWLPAPVDLFRDMVPNGWDKQTVERDGMILMIRPKELTDQRRASEIRRAEGQVQEKLADISGTPDGQLERVVNKIERTIEGGRPDKFAIDQE